MACQVQSVRRRLRARWRDHHWLNESRSRRTRGRVVDPEPAAAFGSPRVEIPGPDREGFGGQHHDVPTQHGGRLGERSAEHVTTMRCGEWRVPQQRLRGGLNLHCRGIDESSRQGRTHMIAVTFRVSPGPVLSKWASYALVRGRAVTTVAWVLARHGGRGRHTHW